MAFHVYILYFVHIPQNNDLYLRTSAHQSVCRRSVRELDVALGTRHSAQLPASPEEGVDLAPLMQCLCAERQVQPATQHVALRVCTYMYTYTYIKMCIYMHMFRHTYIYIYIYTGKPEYIEYVKH